MHTLTISENKIVAYINPCKPNGELYSELKKLGALVEKKSEPETITVPLSSENALALRYIFTARPLTVSKIHGSLLTELADDKQVTPFEVFPSRIEGKTIINAQGLSLKRFSALQKYLYKIESSQELEPDVFMVLTSELGDIQKECPFLKIFPSLIQVDPFEGVPTSRHENAGKTPVRESSKAPVTRRNPELEQQPINVDITPQNSIQQVSLPHLEPFTGFDGTLASLRWVPLEAYEFIRKNSEKTSRENRKINEWNKNNPKKKKKANRSLAQKLSSMGVNNAFEILHHFPLRHINRSEPKLIRQLTMGEEAAVLATVSSVDPNYQKRYVKITFVDMVGSRFSSLFMNQMYLAHMYRKGDQVIVNGKFSPFRGNPGFNNAKIDKLGSSRAIPMIPVYSQSGKNDVSTWDMMKLIEETLSRFGSKNLEDPLPNELVQKYRIPDRNTAYKNIHFPSNSSDFTDANRRLIYEELFRLQLMIQQQRQDITRSQGISQNSESTPTVDHWLSGLPYELTGAQKRAISDIQNDMSSSIPMYRLIQGDVGSGKTSVCLWTVLNSLDNGYQSAVLAPTEILAEQLFNGLNDPVQNLINPVSGMPLRIEFLASKTRKAKAREIREGLADGTVDIVVGTHAILTEETSFKNLGTVVIDEQHRFGVEQRSILRKERADGRTPDMLLMTATPIPRSSSMVLYGDLDLTILDELPPGRTPIETIWQRVNAQRAVEDWKLDPWSDIRNEVSKGHQAYIVASLVEDNEKIAAQSVMDAYEKLSSNVFPELKLGVVHGKQKREEREEIMKSFANNEINVLIATTVIEVGVNVPNSTVMVILDPGRFGIAQLHQIRGRVGRSNLPSRCWLVGETSTEEGEFRLNALVDSTDGFYLSEKDLELRGEGTLFSTKQSGQSDLYLAKIREHVNILEVAKNDARNFLENDPSLSSPSGRIFAGEMEDIFGDKEIKS